MAGIKKLRRIQLGRETTAGAEVNATTLWRGTGTLQDNTETVFPEEDVGYLSGVNRSYIPKVGGQLDLDETPCTYEQIVHLLEMGIKTATPSTVGGQYWYTYDFPTTAAGTLKNYTIEAGDNQQEEQMLYGYCSNFNLSGSAGEAVTMSGTLIGRQVAIGSFTALTPPTVEEVLFSKGGLYIDAMSTSATAWGTTVKASTFLDFNLDVDTGWRPVYTGDGALYFTFIKNIGPEVTMNVTFEHETIGVAEVAAWRAGTARLIEVKFTGSALGTTGTAYSAKTLRIQLAGQWESFEKIGEKDGNDVLTGLFRARYDATGLKFGNVIVACNLATVP